MASQWLGLFLQFIGVAMVTAVAFIAVLEHHFSTVDPGECFLCVHVQVDLLADREAIAFMRFQQNPTMSYNENVAFFRHVVSPSIKDNAS